MNYFNKFITENDKVVEIGAGIRNYSIELVDKAKEVVAIDLFEENVNNLNLKKIQNLKAQMGDIVDLSNIKDNILILLLLMDQCHICGKKQLKKQLEFVRKMVTFFITIN